MLDHSHQAENLRQAMRDAGVQTPEYRPEPDWKALFETVRLELAYQAEHEQMAQGIVEVQFEDLTPGDRVTSDEIDQVEEAVKSAFRAGIKHALDRMEQAETFARVRAEFKSTEGGS